MPDIHVWDGLNPMVHFGLLLTASSALRRGVLTRGYVVASASIVTLESLTRHEQVITKSRFIAIAAPVQTADAANAFVKEHSDPKARHNCFAWRLPNGDTRTNGDGEPGGTAGPPILAAISGAGLHGVAVLVSRYRLGEGAKLGTGGLVRAYGGTASQCLSVAPLIELDVSPTVGALARFAAVDTGAVFALLAPYSRVMQTTVIPSEPPETIARFEAPEHELVGLDEQMRTATNGRVTLMRLDEEGLGGVGGEDEDAEFWETHGDFDVEAFDGEFGDTFGEEADADARRPS